MIKATFVSIKIGEMVTTYERSSWRDQALSARHRLWGFNCPAADIDFLMMEYNLGLPVAIVEYKKICGRPPDLLHPTYQALVSLANSADILFLIVVYDAQQWIFRVLPVNAKAIDFYKTDTFIEYSEREYVESLYRMRGQEVSGRLLRQLSDIKPGDQSAPVVPPSSNANNTTP